MKNTALNSFSILESVKIGDAGVVSIINLPSTILLGIVIILSLLGNLITILG